MIGVKAERCSVLNSMVRHVHIMLRHVHCQAIANDQIGLDTLAVLLF